MDTIKINKGNTKMIAHRGLSGIEVENTLPAFVAAGNRSYWGIETDVHKTIDGHYVVFHDDTTGRLCVDDMTVEKSTFDCLRNLKIVDKEGKKGRIDLRIPTLAEYIRVCKTYDKKAVLELKNEFTCEEIFEIAAIIEEEGYFENTVFISFCIANLLYLRSKYPSAWAQFLVDDYSDSLIEILHTNSLELDIKWSSLTEENLATLHSEGIVVNCWACDDVQYAENLAKWGIEYISSNILE